jgi:Papain family cysteine protease
MRWITPLLLFLSFVPFVTSQEQRATGYKPPTPERRAALYAADRISNGGRVAMAAKFAAPPAKFDCVEMGWCPPIRDQGNCGSCYGVATADQLTCTFIKAGYQKNDDSFEIDFQFGMDRCGPDFGGCNGGWGAEVADWMVKNGWPATRYVDAKGTKISDYPAYEARPRNCREQAGAKRWKPAAWGFCSGSSNQKATVLEIKTCLMQYGVVNIAFNATSAYSNAGSKVVRITGGANHETTLVGWDDAKGWKTRGNWGENLGDGGYVWMTFDSQLVDPFWMTATPLPPPPPPPDPDPPIPPDPDPGPGPKPGSAVTITLLPSGMYSISGGIIVTKNMTVADLVNKMQGVKSAPNAEPMSPAKPCDQHGEKIKELEKNQERLLKIIEDLQKTLKPTPKKTSAAPWSKDALYVGGAALGYNVVQHKGIEYVAVQTHKGFEPPHAEYWRAARETQQFASLP